MSPEAQATLVRTRATHGIDARGGGLLTTGGKGGNRSTASAVNGGGNGGANGATAAGTNDSNRGAAAANAGPQTSFGTTLAAAGSAGPQSANGGTAGSGTAAGALTGLGSTGATSPMASLAAGMAPASGLVGPPVAAHVAAPVGTPGFAQDFASRVVLLAQNGTHSAQLSLHPVDLGPVSVSIQMNGQAATLALAAHHEATRDAMQQALPRLQEMFQQNGLQLADAHIGNGSAYNPLPQQRPGSGGRGRGGGSGTGGSITAPAALAATGGRASTSSLRLVDTFA
ncbi:flagellar hook-length control protein [Burkholderiales bacterium GJ-E10]|nr:flagellar hook-length control protein [Burkholderiales bacterium GJ-E10]